MNHPNNIALWDKVKQTDPQYTKQVTQRGGYTSISPQYQMREATNQFGPYGKGWGFSSCEMDMSVVDALGIVIVKAVFFYVLDGERHEFPVNNSWTVIMGAGDKRRVDADFAKKAETNTMSKALSKLGFSADVFLGEFDDTDYVEHIGNVFALEKADNKIDEEARQKQERQEWIDKATETIRTCGSVHELKGVYTSLVRKANTRKDTEAVKIFGMEKDNKKEQLESNDE